MKDVAGEEWLRLVSHQWFRRHAMLVDEEHDFVHLEMYAWDGEFHRGVTSDTLRSCAWWDDIAFYAVDLSTRGPVSDKATRHIRDVNRGMMSLLQQPSVQKGQDVDMWRSRTFREDICGTACS